MVSLHTQIGKEKKIFLEDRQMIELDGYYRELLPVNIKLGKKFTSIQSIIVFLWIDN